VVRVERVRSFSGEPCVAERIVLRGDGLARLDQLLDRLKPESIYSLLEQEYRIMIVRVSEQLRSVAADAADAKLLGISAGYPLLEIDRTALSLDQQIIEWRVSRCNSRYLHYANDQT